MCVKQLSVIRIQVVDIADQRCSETDKLGETDSMTSHKLTHTHTLKDNTHTFTNWLSYTALSAFFFSFERNYYLYPARSH